MIGLTRPSRHVSWNHNLQRITAIVVLSAIVFTGQARADNVYELVFVRDEVNRNVITLTCRVEANSMNVPDAFYFLNGARIDTRPAFQRLTESGGVRFRVTRSLEGNYTCGPQNPQSNTKSLIG